MAVKIPSEIIVSLITVTNIRALHLEYKLFIRDYEVTLNLKSSLELHIRNSSCVSF